MDINNNRTDIKKRLMFSKDEDYYFITYNVLVFLNTIDCSSDKAKFIDYTKLSYITPFVSNSGLLDILLKYRDLNRLPSKEEIDLLQETYIKSRLRINLVTSILLALESKSLIGLMKNGKRKSIDIWINKQNVPKSFLESSLFKIEKNNSLALKRTLPQIKTLRAQTLNEQLFKRNGVRIWEEV